MDDTERTKDVTDDLKAHASTEQLDKAVDYFKQWMILGPPGAVVPGTRYQVKGRMIRKFLQYEKQGTFGGINLGWTDNADPETARKVTHWVFAHDGSDRRPLVYGEKVGIAWKGDYIYYGHREIGINLKWSDSPRLEWQLLGGRPGSVVRTGEWLSLFNTSAGDGEPMIYFERTGPGADLGWPSSQTWGQQLKNMAFGAAKKAVIDYLKGGSSGK